MSVSLEAHALSSRSARASARNPSDHRPARFGCDKFWTLRAFAIEGTSVRAGVFVHELSHLYAFTDDYTNDPEEAKQLVIENPNWATGNAENWERFSLHQYLVRLTPVLF